MPCDSSYMRPDCLEIECSKMWAILDGLENGKPIDPETYGDGSDLRSYRKATRQMADDLAQRLCKRLSKLSSDELRNLPLESQMWWRDHQAADAARIAKEQEQLRLQEKRDRKEFERLKKKYEEEK